MCANIANIEPIDVAAAVQHVPWMRVEQFNMISAAEGARAQVERLLAGGAPLAHSCQRCSHNLLPVLRPALLGGVSDTNIASLPGRRASTQPKHCRLNCDSKANTR